MDEDDIVEAVLKDEDLAAILAEVVGTSRDGQFNINFRSEAKPELSFDFADSETDAAGKENEEAPTASNGSSNSPLFPTTASPKKTTVRREMMQKMERQHDMWQAALKSFTVQPNLVDGLVGFHRRGLCTVTKSMLKVHVVALAKLVADFASLLPGFKELPRNVQKLLLSENAPLFVQYIFCRFDFNIHFPYI